MATHKWSTEAAEIAKSQMRGRVMTPKPIKKEGGVEKAIDDWFREVDNLEEIEGM